MALLIAAHLLLAGPVIEAADYGLVADGRSDDGPAIAAAMAALRAAGPSARLAFPGGQTLRVTSAPQTWVFWLEGLQNVAVEGRGTTLILGPDLRFAFLRANRGVRLSGFRVDHDPLPFADGTVIGVNPDERWIDVRVDEGYALPPDGGPTGEREQAYFAMLLHPARHGYLHEHYWVADQREAEPGSRARRVLRVWRGEGGGWGQITPGVTRVSLPVRGIAHRMEGFGASVELGVEGCEDVRLEDLDLWSPPLFGIGISRNRGLVTVRRVNVEPRPGTGRLTSAWRDGIHVKSNRAALVFEQCRLTGTHDDAFNIATHGYRVTAVHSPTEIEVNQVFPLGYVPFEPGDLLQSYALARGGLQPNARVVSSHDLAARDVADPTQPTVPQAITLAAPWPGVAVGDVVWNLSAANPRTVLRECQMDNACRLQSPVRLERCRLTGLGWFYGDPLEGPLPHDVEVVGCTLRQGRGNPELALVFGPSVTQPDGSPPQHREPSLRRLLLRDNEIDGAVSFAWCADVRLESNRFVGPQSRLTMADCDGVALVDNTREGQPLLAPDGP